MTAAPPALIRKDVCDAIRAASGTQLLQLMAAMVQFEEGERGFPAAPEGTVAEALALGLLTRSDQKLVITQPGSLVGSVAKEYCNWLDYGRRMPPPRPPEAMIAGKDVLDLGCGFGRWLWEFQTIANSVLGIEMQSDYLTLGKALAECEGIQAPEIRQGSAEDLDQLVPEQSLDFIFCRLMFTHVSIVYTLRKTVAALRSRGVLWIQVCSFRHAARRALKRRGLRGKAFEAFGLVNSLVCMASGKQIRLRIPGRMASVHKPAYPTLGWWGRTLSAQGLSDFRTHHDGDGTLVFSAVKP